MALLVAAMQVLAGIVQDLHPCHGILHPNKWDEAVYFSVMVVGGRTRS
jgi:hypothetical protein